MQTALVNTNRIRPPIGPIGIDYVAEATAAAGHRVDVLDLCWADDWRGAIDDFLGRNSFDLIGLTLRNTDDCMFSSRASFLGEFAAIAAAIRQLTDAPMVVGGVGFSVMPEQILESCGCELGISGEGEFAFAALADRLREKEEWHRVPNLVWRADGQWRRNPPAPGGRQLELPPMSRRWVDNRRYFDEGGQAGIETKRGCPYRCIYCAEPQAKGKVVRWRSPRAVADELEQLLEQGIDHVHTCDSEFNIPPRHALEVCEELGRRRLGERLRWYAYCTPAGFPAELASAMAAAGCVGINFGVDNGDAEMLRRLRRGFAPEDVVRTTRWCGDAGMAVMLDLLLGAPGESAASITATIELMRRVEADRVGVTLGVRVYPGTELATLAAAPESQRGLVGGANLDDPLYFVEPAIAATAGELLERLVGDDERFFYAAAGPARDYNYNANEQLVEAIGRGHRGAYWDILRRCRSAGGRLT